MKMEKKLQIADERVLVYKRGEICEHNVGDVKNVKMKYSFRIIHIVLALLFIVGFIALTIGCNKYSEYLKEEIARREEEYTYVNDEYQSYMSELRQGVTSKGNSLMEAINIAQENEGTINSYEDDVWSSESQLHYARLDYEEFEHLQVSFKSLYVVIFVLLACLVLKKEIVVSYGKEQDKVSFHMLQLSKAKKLVSHLNEVIPVIQSKQLLSCDGVKKIFAEEHEEAIATIGSTYVNSMENGSVIASDKRLYFRGKQFFRKNRKYKVSNEARTIGLEFVAGSRYVNKRHVILNIMSFMNLPMLTMVTLIIFGLNYRRYEEHMLGLLFPFSIMALTALITGFLFKDKGSKVKKIMQAIIVFAAPVSVFIANVSGNYDVYRRYEIFIPAAIVFSIFYFVFRAFYLGTKKELFEVLFTNGGIAFETKSYSKTEIEAFCKRLNISHDV